MGADLVGGYTALAFNFSQSGGSPPDRLHFVNPILRTSTPSLRSSVAPVITSLGTNVSLRVRRPAMGHARVRAGTPLFWTRLRRADPIAAELRAVGATLRAVPCGLPVESSICKPCPEGKRGSRGQPPWLDHWSSDRPTFETFLDVEPVDLAAPDGSALQPGLKMFGSPVKRMPCTSTPRWRRSGTQSSPRVPLLKPTKLSLRSWMIKRSPKGCRTGPAVRTKIAAGQWSLR